MPADQRVGGWGGGVGCGCGGGNPEGPGAQAALEEQKSQLKDFRDVADIRLFPPAMQLFQGGLLEASS